MKFKFVLTERDYVDFNLFYNKNLKFLKKQRKTFRIIFTLLPIIIIILFLPIEGIYSNVPLSIFFIILSLILSVLIFHFYFKLNDSAMEGITYKILNERKHDFPFEMTISFEDDKIISTKKFENVSMGYEKIKSLEISDKAIYVFTEIARAIILPNHIFASNAEKQELIDFINSKIK
ncbi:YcxB family protein [Oceanivirga salmonicida]|uniref:YcxB family protein n=1 Tax=Oceanivirga salmonicida TaxID=1769291 RepID=UPI0012E295D5|nr:YcxB family protein [Oceanivirga salmonicida]